MSKDQMPTTPDDTGNWYREGGEIVKVELNKSTNLFSGLVYYRHGSQYALSVAPDGLWRGPVPMPGEWAPRELFDDLWYEVARLSPDKGSSAYDAVQAAKVWDEQNPAPEVTR